MTRSSEDAETTDRGVRTRASSARPRATRKRAVRKASETRVDEVVEVAPTPRSTPEQNRKAPTGIGTTKSSQRQKRRQLLVALVLVVVGVGASAAVGLTDAGQIDVQKTIEARNERIRNNQANDSDTITSKIEVPVQDTKAQKADGGLRGLGTGGAKPQAPAPVASSTATSSDATASSSDTASSTPAELVETESASSSDTSAQ